MVLVSSAAVIILHGQSLECFSDVVLANTVDRSVVNKELNEVFTVNVRLVLSFLSQDRETYLISHVLHFHLSGVVSHGSHQERQLLNRYDSLKSTGRGGVFLHTSDHGVHEEVIHILESLSFTSSFDEVDEWFDGITSVHGDLFINRGDVNIPYVN